MSIITFIFEILKSIKINCLYFRSMKKKSYESPNRSKEQNKNIEGRTKTPFIMCIIIKYKDHHVVQIQTRKPSLSLLLYFTEVRTSSSPTVSIELAKKQKGVSRCSHSPLCNRDAFYSTLKTKKTLISYYICRYK